MLNDITENKHIYFHSPGDPTQNSVLDVGLKCVHSCKFCYYSFLDNSENQFEGMRKASFRTFIECKEILNGLKANGFKSFDITGGEPSIHPDIIELVRYAHQELGLKGRMITLGQFLLKKLPNCKKKHLLADLIEAGLTNFLFSLHAANEDIFKATTGESFNKLKLAMNYLDEINYSYTTNTVLYEGNYHHLPDIVDEILSHNIYMHNIIVMNAYYGWNQGGKAFGVQAKYSHLHDAIAKAIDRLESRNVAVNVRYVPLCSGKGFEKNLVGGVGVRYDPYEWMNKAGHKGGNPTFCSSPLTLTEAGPDTDWAYKENSWGFSKNIAKRSAVKVFPQKCSSCHARSSCDGIDPNYLENHGDSEFIPYTDAKYGPVNNDRSHYYPAYVVKTEQFYDLKYVMAQAFESYRLGEEFYKSTDIELLREDLITPESVAKIKSKHILVHSKTVKLAPDIKQILLRAITSAPLLQLAYGDIFIEEDSKIFLKRSPVWSMLFLAKSFPPCFLISTEILSSFTKFPINSPIQRFAWIIRLWKAGVKAKYLARPVGETKALDYKGSLAESLRAKFLFYINI